MERRSEPIASGSDKMSKLPDLIRNPGNIPFVWEKTPGRPKHDTKSRNANESLEAVRSPNIPTTNARNLYSERINLSYVKPEKIWSCAEGYAEKESFSSDQDDEETNVVEQDTFSRSDSSLDNLSVSDFSSGTNEGLTGTVVSADSHTRDFIMGRFLSAAKAMASEMPPHSSKNKPIVSSNYTQTDIEEEDSEEDMNDEEDQINRSVKGCRLLAMPCFFSPVPEMRMSPQKRVQLVGKLVRANCFRTGHGTKWGTEIRSAASDKRTKIHDDRSRPSVESAFARNEYFRRNNHKQSRNFATGPETFNNFRGFLQHQNKVHESQPEIHVVEKTLYIIDSGHRTDQTPRTLPAREDRKIFTKNYGRRFRDKTDISADVPSNDSSLQKFKYLSIADEKKGLKTEIMPIPQSPLPPPLPNSPSDSWLHLALPSNFSKNQAHRSFHVKKQDPRQKRVDPKWETMVNTSYPYRGHLPYTQMLTPIPELEVVNISINQPSNILSRTMDPCEITG